MIDVQVFWTPPGFRPLSDEAIQALCNGDAKPDVRAQRADTLLVRVNDHQGEYGND
jgi:hypothetical protein